MQILSEFFAKMMYISPTIFHSTFNPQNTRLLFLTDYQNSLIDHILILCNKTRQSIKIIQTIY